MDEIVAVVTPVAPVVEETTKEVHLGWQPTPANLAQIEKDSSIGLNQGLIAAGFGFHHVYFSSLKVKYPEIALAMERGRRKGIEELMALSRQIACDPKCGQAERDRLGRMLKTEHIAEQAITIDPTAGATQGFTVSIVSKKNPNLEVIAEEDQE